MKIKVKEIVSYKGHSISANGAVNFTVKAMYSQLTNTIKLMQLLNNDVTIKAKLPEEKPMKLGSFRLKQITVDGDGESSIKFNGVVDYIEVDNLNLLPLNNSESKEFTVLFESDIEIEEDAGEEE